jgi:hypothetical protein
VKFFRHTYQYNLALVCGLKRCHQLKMTETAKKTIFRKSLENQTQTLWDFGRERLSNRGWLRALVLHRVRPEVLWSVLFQQFTQQGSLPNQQERRSNLLRRSILLQQTRRLWKSDLRQQYCI